MKKEKERISIFIDGSNFYYSTSKKGIKIDFQKLISELIGNRELVNVFYYVAPLDIEANEEKYWAHQRFLDKLNQIPKFKVVLCTLKKIKINRNFIYFVKGDDVKLSNNLLIGAVDDLYDTAIIISGDEDFIDSIDIIRRRYKKKMGNAYFSKSSSSNLRKSCDFTINLNKIINNITKNEDESSVLSENHTEH